MTTQKNLEDLYNDQLQDLWSANRQMEKVVPDLLKAANDDALKNALENAQRGVKKHTDHLESICERRGVKASGEHCKGMEGLVAEARNHGLKADMSGEVQDASIITQFQRMSHYGIAGFGTAKAFAKRLKLDDDVKLIDQDLEEIYEGDELFTKIAEGEVNPAAQAAQ